MNRSLYLKLEQVTGIRNLQRPRFFVLLLQSCVPVMSSSLCFHSSYKLLVPVTVLLFHAHKIVNRNKNRSEQNNECRLNEGDKRVYRIRHFPPIEARERVQYIADLAALLSDFYHLNHNPGNNGAFSNTALSTTSPVISSTRTIGIAAESCVCMLSAMRER